MCIFSWRCCLASGRTSHSQFLWLVRLCCSGKIEHLCKASGITSSGRRIAMPQLKRWNAQQITFTWLHCNERLGPTLPNLIFTGSSGQCDVGRIIQKQQSIPPPPPPPCINYFCFKGRNSTQLHCMHQMKWLIMKLLQLGEYYRQTHKNTTSLVKISLRLTSISLFYSTFPNSLWKSTLSSAWCCKNAKSRGGTCIKGVWLRCCWCWLETLDSSALAQLLLYPSNF